MDTFLVNYLLSGNAWVLMGSGPSIEMGYPTWKELASSALDLIKLEAPESNHSSIDRAQKNNNFPLVFEEACSALGAPRVLSHLQNLLKPSRPGRVYELIAQWPVGVYLTTNYDDEIHSQLAMLGEAYNTYTNSEDHFGHLHPGISGAIFKLHGDLRSEEGLVLTESQYRMIDRDNAWEYWRTKMTSVFQMIPVIVIGHSLSDPNIKHVLKSAKRGAGVLRPICWIAPDVDPVTSKEFLEKYRVRVIPYDNRDGSHSNLLRVIENISQFIYTRSAITVKKEIELVSKTPLGTNAAAPGYFVFSKLARRDDFDLYRVDIVCAAIQAIIPRLMSIGEFTLEEALYLAGWPEDSSVSIQFARQLCSRAIEQGLLLETEGGKLQVGPQAQILASENKRLFEHIKGRFFSSLMLRLKRDYPQLKEEEATEVISDIESSLIGFFKEGGLSLATTLLSRTRRAASSPVPSSIIKFITLSSARYKSLLKRQAFVTVSINIFTQPEEAEKDYLGRISQGYFAFHALGLFGETALERLRTAQSTVWLVDSSAQIPSLAFAAPTNEVFRDCFSRLKEMGVRLFSTERLFDETREHLWFANKVIEDNGPFSYLVMAGAQGQPPYRKSNQFLEGFIRWQAAGNPCDWEAYQYACFGHRRPTTDHLREALYQAGVEVIAFENWPGFTDSAAEESRSYIQDIVQLWEDKLNPAAKEDPDFFADYYKKAEPEAEALVIVVMERAGKLHILSLPNVESQAWFISQTSMLNLIAPKERITWQPEAFLRFTSTLAPKSGKEEAHRAFNMLLLAFSQVGVSLLDEKTLARAFGGIIDQATLTAAELADMYDEALASKYSESPESIIARLPPINRPLAAIQLASEIAEAQAQMRLRAEDRSRTAIARADRAEKELEEYEGIKLKIEEKRRRRERAKRQRKSRKRNRKRKK